MKLKTRIYLWFLRLKLYWPYRFAHHPLCDRFSGSVFKIGRLYLCQGCTFVYSSLIIGSLIFSLVPIPLKFWIWLVIAAGMLLPSFIVRFISLPRIFTRIARSLLGFYFGWMIGGIVQYSDWLYRGLLMGLAFVSYLTFRIAYRRSKRKTDECSGCPELEQYGICSGYKERMVAEREYSRIATELLEPELEAIARRKVSILEPEDDSLMTDEFEETEK